ncbi:MAG: hypothetical protein ACWIPH_08245 [Ostreibacterium sp.]
MCLFCEAIYALSLAKFSGKKHWLLTGYFQENCLARFMGVFRNAGNSTPTDTRMDNKSANGTTIHTPSVPNNVGESKKRFN